MQQLTVVIRMLTFRSPYMEPYPETTAAERATTFPPVLKDQLLLPTPPQRRQNRKSRPKSMVALADSERDLEDLLKSGKRRYSERFDNSYHHHHHQYDNLSRTRSMANVSQYQHRGSKSNRSSPRKEMEANLYAKKKQKQSSPRKAKIEQRKRLSLQNNDENQQFYPNPEDVMTMAQNNESDSESEFYSILGGAL